MLTWPLKFVKMTCSPARLPGDLISRMVTKKSPNAVEAVPVMTGSGARVRWESEHAWAWRQWAARDDSDLPSDRMSGLGRLLSALMSSRHVNLRAISLSVSPNCTVYFCALAGVGVLVGAACGRDLGLRLGIQGGHDRWNHGARGGATGIPQIQDYQDGHRRDDDVDYNEDGPTTRSHKVRTSGTRNAVC
jgi:hypothetical protein